MLGKDLHVARIRRATVEGHRGDRRAAAHLFTKRRVLPVVQTGTELLARHEQVPQALFARPGADLDQFGRVRHPGPDLAVECIVEFGLPGKNVLVHERPYAITETLNLVT